MWNYLEELPKKSSNDDLNDYVQLQLGYVHTILESFLSRHKILSSIVWTPIRYVIGVVLQLRSISERNRAEITVCSRC